MDSRTSPQAKILVVDDEASARSALAELLREEGYAVRTAADGFKALGQLDSWEPDVVLTDVQMPGMSGIELMGKLRERQPGVGVVVMTAFGSVENAVTAMQAGADDYLTKPLHFPEMLLVLERVLHHRMLHQENERLRRAHYDPLDRSGWVGSSRPARELMSMVGQVASSDAPVLIVGESGTGKSLVAQTVHRASPRAQGPFISVPCAALREETLEDELFGSSPDAPGRVGEADGGTLVLDGVDELSLTSQARLLAFLQGGDEPRADAPGPDIRILATTHADLHQRMSEGRFREDLYYRLNVITLRLPTLRERRSDIPLLAMHLLRRHSGRNHRYIAGFSDRALGVLLAFDWPGNVRQLEASVEHAVTLCQHQTIEPRDLPRELMLASAPHDETPPIPGATIAELERYAILTTLEHVGGSTRRAAEILGISTRKIQYRLSEYRERAASGVAAVTSEDPGASAADRATHRARVGTS